MGNSNRIFHPTALYCPPGAGVNRVTILASSVVGPEVLPSQRPIARDPHAARSATRAYPLALGKTAPKSTIKRPETVRRAGIRGGG